MFKLVENWKQCWKWFSVQILAVLMVLPIVWATLPSDVKDWVPHDWQIPIVMALALAGIVGRIIDQGKKPEA
jgi:uncharacterized integral membrane protein